MIAPATDPGAAVGTTPGWPAGRGPGCDQPDMTAVLAIDAARFEAMFVERLQRRWTASRSKIGMVAALCTDAGAFVLPMHPRGDTVDG